MRWAAVAGRRLVVPGSVRVVQLGGGVVATCRHKFSNLDLVFGHGSGLAVNSLCQQAVSFVEAAGVRRLLRLAHKIGGTWVLRS